MTIYNKPDHALYYILTILYLCLEPIGFCLPLSSFPRNEHLITICGHHHHHVCHPCSILDVDLTYLIHNTIVNVSPLGCLNYPNPNIGLSHILHCAQIIRSGKPQAKLSKTAKNIDSPKLLSWISAINSDV